MAIQKGLIHVTDNSGNVVDVHPETEISQVVGLSDALNNKANISDIPTKTSQLTNNSGFITKAVSDLTNYYTKSDLYTSTEVDNLISTIPKFKIEVVQSLPTTDISNSTIYLLKSSTTSGNLYTEYIYINSNWEELGTQEVNLSGYATTTWTTNQINNAKQELTDIIDSNNSDLTDIINGKADENHTHGSDEITVLANYAKYSSNSPLTTDDTLNIALGKLERMMDDKQPRGNYLTNTDTAAKAIADSSGNVINTTYATKDELSQKLDNNSSDFIKSIDVNGTTITYTKGDNTTGTIQTQDTTYPIATVNELSTGTDESGKLISAKNLKEFVSQEIVNNPNIGVQSITSGSENGSISVDGTDIFITGLGSSAFNDASDYATSNHTHSSNNIDLMTGYTPIAIDSTHIQPSDTLNQAINKLESTLENKSDSSNVPTKMSDLLNDTGYITDVSWDDVSNKPTSFNPVNHNQPSNTINEMTGYVKGNNTDPIEETDSLNDAIGKLEAVLDTKASSNSVSNINSILNDKQDVLNIISPEELDSGLSTSKRAVSAQVISNYVTSKIDEVQNNIPTKVSELTNDTGYITEISWEDVNDKPTTFTPSTPLMTAAEATAGTLTEARLISPKVLDDKIDEKITVSDDTSIPNNVGNGDFWIQNVENSQSPQYSTVIPADINHTHGSDKIISMTGYSKPSTTSNINYTDTLNQAIGKLERAIELNSNPINITPGETNGTISVNGNEVEITGLGSAAYTDSSDYVAAGDTASDSSRLGGIEASNYAQLNSPIFTGTPTAPTPSSNDNSNKIATTEFVQNKLDSIEDQVQSDWDELDSTEKSFILNKPFGYVNEYVDIIYFILGTEYEKPPLVNNEWIYNVTLDLSGIKDNVLFYCNENSPLELPIHFALTARDLNHTPNIPNGNINVDGTLTIEYFIENGVSGYRGTTPMIDSKVRLEFETDETFTTINYAKVIISNSAGRLASYYVMFIQIPGHNDTKLVKVPLKYIPDQPSSIITSMSGYVKSSTVSAINTTDTLNQAIGKLEAALSDVQSIIPVMTSSEATDGTSTDGRIISPKVLNDKIDEKISSIPSIVVSDDTDMPNTVKVEDFWIQLTDSSILQDANNFQF